MSKGFSQADLDAVTDNPEWTQDTAARAKSLDETFPGVVRRGRQKAPTKVQITLRLDQRVVDHFRSTGDGWQTRMNDALLKAAGL